MKIIPYDELKDSYQFLRVMDASFGWAATPERVAKIRKIDERYKYPYGFCLMKGKTLAGFTGVMDIPVKTVDGKIEKVGGIHIVATYPAFNRQGIAKTLMDQAHEHFKKQGYRFSFLWTSHSLVAHSLYKKIGYSDVPLLNQLPRAYKFLPEKKIRITKGKAKPSVDMKLIARIYDKAMQNKTGFAVRIKNWVQVVLKARRMNPEIVAEKDGYAIGDNSSEALFIWEFIADNPETYLRIIDRLKKKGKRVLIDAFVLDPALFKIYEKQGFKFRYGSYASLMVKSLTNVSFAEAFGDKFYFTPIDGF